MNSLIKFFMLVLLAKFTYSVEYAIESKQVYEIVKHQQVVFTCTHDGTITIREFTQLGRGDIVIDSAPIDDRYTYMNTTVDGKLVHKITLKNATLDLHSAGYTCYKNTKICCMIRIRIPHRQEAPMCITNYYNKTIDELTYFECLSRYAYPMVTLEPIISDAEIGYHIENRSNSTNGTYTSRRVEISGEVEDIDMFKCTATQNFLGTLDTKVCYFGSPPNTILPTMSMMPSTTITLDYTVDSNEHNSGKSIYRSLILILVCLLIH